MKLKCYTKFIQLQINQNEQIKCLAKPTYKKLNNLIVIIKNEPNALFCLTLQYYIIIMIKQNQSHDLLFRPFPHENPQCKAHDGLSLDSNCTCPPCKTRPDKIKQQIAYDKDLDMLKSKKSRTKSTFNNTNTKSMNSTNNNDQHKAKASDLVIFINQIYKNSPNCLPNLPILDTIIFNNDGSVKHIVNFENSKLKISKLSTNLKTYIVEQKYHHDLQFQKKKYQREHMGFSFTQLDHRSEKYIKQFQNNIKFMNPLLNRVVIAKIKGKQQEQILSQNQINGLFVKVSRKLYDFSNMQYMQIFPVMYGHQQSSYVKKVKYFRDREVNKKNFKIAEHYVGNWYSKNQTLEDLQQQFLTSIKNDQEQTLMYYTYKLFIFFQKISNKMVQNALLSFMTNDQGNTFYLKNIECLNLFNLHQVQQRVRELPKKIDNYNIQHQVDLRKQMKYNFDIFHRNYQRLQRQRKDMDKKLQNDVDFSNQVYQSLGNKIPNHNKSSSFIKSISDLHSGKNQNLLQIQEKAQNYVLFKSLQQLGS